MAIRQLLPENRQVELPGGAIVSSEVHRLQFALLPDPATRLAIAALAGQLQASYPHFRARWIQPAHYAATLRVLGEDSALQPWLVEAAIKAADRVMATRFDWTLDTVETLRGREPPCLLRSETLSEPLLHLWQSLGKEMSLAGLPIVRESDYLPQVFLAHGHGSLLGSMAVDPLMWRIDAFALVHSVSGRNRQEILGSWPLLGP